MDTWTSVIAGSNEFGDLKCRLTAKSGSEMIAQTRPDQTHSFDRTSGGISKRDAKGVQRRGPPAAGRQRQTTRRTTRGTLKAYLGPKPGRATCPKSSPGNTSVTRPQHPATPCPPTPWSPYLTTLQATSTDRGMCRTKTKWQTLPRTVFQRVPQGLPGMWLRASVLRRWLLDPCRGLLHWHTLALQMHHCKGHLTLCQ